MKNLEIIKQQFQNKELDNRLADIYGEATDIVEAQRNRYLQALEKFKELFGFGEVEIYSAPGRTEIGGNHTDHQHGRVLAGSVNLDTVAVVGTNDENTIELISEGYAPITIDLNDLTVDKEAYGTTAALIKGVAAGLQERGYKVGPFKAYMTSNVLNGAGLSSSAAFETAIGTIFSGMYNEGKVSAVEIAMIGQYAENVYFGKPCGLMDQMACSVGSIVAIDFEDTKAPIVDKVEFDLDAQGYNLCIVDTKGSHADLTDEYAAVPGEMKEVAALFGRQVLREVSEEEFMNKLPEIYETIGHRNILRALHFFEENKRVQKEVKALQEESFDEFLNLVKESGDSSYKYLQNIYSNKDVQNQPVSIGLALSEIYLGSNGVCRVHGGGFAGTIQAFVKKEAVEDYKNKIEKIFGEGTCHVLRIRKYGGVKVV